MNAVTSVIEPSMALGNSARGIPWRQRTLYGGKGTDN
jgi:hypothetical protein